MINVTPALREHLVKSFAMKADASEEEAQKLAATKFAAGELTSEKLKELTISGSSDKAAELTKTIAEATAKAVAEALKAATPATTPATVDPSEAVKKAGDELFANYEKRLKEMEESFEKRASEKLEKVGAGATGATDVLKMGIDLSKEDDPVSLRVKGVLERYNSDCRDAVREKGIHKGQVIKHKGQVLKTASQQTKAMIAAWFKFTVAPEYLNEREKAILLHILHKEPFICPEDARGWDDEIAPRKLRDAEIAHFKSGAFIDQMTKATTLLDGATSGGSYAVPEFFDREVVLLPILGNELAPLCNIKDVPRGSAAQGFTMGNPSIASNMAEGTALTLFTTDSFIANKDTTFFRCGGAIEIGLNFLEDAVPGLADEIVGAYSRKMAEWLDEQVAIGDGTTEPQGLFSASGTTDITFTTPTTGPYTITDVLNLLFGVAKAYRYNYPSRQAAFVMTDTGYKKLRQIATGVTGDTRLIFGEDVESYQLFGHPVAIVATGMTNDQFAFAQMGGYRLYRRQAPRFRRTMEGITLLKTNTMAILCDARYGGQLDRGGYAAVATSGIP